MRLLCGLLAFLYLYASTSLACTTFQIPGSLGQVYGKSYDWHADHGVAFVNKRGVRKTAVQLQGDGEPATWESRFGSVTFSQHGRDMPLGGMNEVGLVVDIMIVGSTYPTQTAKPVLNELQWIQYILDTAETIDEAVLQAQAVDVDKLRVGVHYLVCDRFGGCAAFEYIDGRLSISADGDTVVPTLANSTYEQSLEFLRLHRGFGGNRNIPQGSGSLDRFVRASHLSARYDSEQHGDEGDYAFDVLNSVAAGSTVWQIVYNPGDQSIALRHTASRSEHQFGLADLDFSCGTAVQYRDLDGDVTGSTDSVFQPYSRDVNYDLVDVGNRSLGSTFSDHQVRQLAAYPETTVCVTE